MSKMFQKCRNFSEMSNFFRNVEIFQKCRHFSKVSKSFEIFQKCRNLQKYNIILKKSKFSNRKMIEKILKFWKKNFEVFKNFKDYRNCQKLQSIDFFLEKSKIISRKTSKFSELQNLQNLRKLLGGVLEFGISTGKPDFWPVFSGNVVLVNFSVNFHNFFIKMIKYFRESTHSRFQISRTSEIRKLFFQKF